MRCESTKWPKDICLFSRGWYNAALISALTVRIDVRLSQWMHIDIRDKSTAIKHQAKVSLCVPHESAVISWQREKVGVKKVRNLTWSSIRSAKGTFYNLIILFDAESHYVWRARSLRWVRAKQIILICRVCEWRDKESTVSFGCTRIALNIGPVLNAIALRKKD